MPEKAESLMQAAMDVRKEHEDRKQQQKDCEDRAKLAEEAGEGGASDDPAAVIGDPPPEDEG